MNHHWDVNESGNPDFPYVRFTDADTTPRERKRRIRTSFRESTNDAATNWIVVSFLVVAAALLLVFLSGCASPGDVEQRHADELYKYHQDIATANEWNTHVLGIPASGWLAIILFAIIFGVGLLGYFGYLTYGVLEDRRRNKHAMQLKIADTQRIALQRGNCPVCGHVPSAEVEDGTGNKK